MPPLTITNSGALVGGGYLKAEELPMSNAPTPPSTLKGKVLRAFYYGGAVLKVDSVHELPRLFALEMCEAKKLEIVKESVAVAPAVPPPAKPVAAEKRAALKESVDAK